MPGFFIHYLYILNQIKHIQYALTPCLNKTYVLIIRHFFSIHI
jgi:hypothetical protein